MGGAAIINAVDMFIIFIYVCEKFLTIQSNPVFGVDKASETQTRRLVRSFLAIKDPIIQENEFVRHILAEEQTVSNANQNLERLSFRQRTMEAELWIAIERAAIELFEEEYGSDAVIDYNSIEREKGIGFYERTKRVRVERWKWMFKNHQKDSQAHEILSAIKNRTSYPSSADEFASSIGDAFDELSEDLTFRLLQRAMDRPVDGGGKTLEPHASAALDILLSTYSFKGKNPRFKDKLPST